MHEYEEKYLPIVTHELSQRIEAAKQAFRFKHNQLAYVLQGLNDSCELEKIEVDSITFAVYEGYLVSMTN